MQRRAARALPGLSQQMSRLVMAGEALDRGAAVLELGIGEENPGERGRNH